MTKQVNVKINHLNIIKFMLSDCNNINADMIINDIVSLLNTKDIERVKKVISNFISSKLGILGSLDILKRMYIY